MSPQTNPSLNDLRARWRTLLAELEVDPARADELFDDIAARYSEPLRHYHNLTHIQTVLDTLSQMHSKAQNPLALRLAAWLHDAIYEPDAIDNELRSADFAADLLRGLGVTEDLVAEVHRLIVLTEHKRVPEDLDARMLLDADLSTLAAEPATFDDIGVEIQKEYNHISKEQYRDGRIRFFGSFLTRPRIYCTDEMYEKYERTARQNLERELHRLEEDD